MQNGKVFHKTTLALILISLFVLSACSGRNTANAGAASVATVSTVTITDQIETSGNLSADQLVSLTWGTSGLVEKVNVKIGQKVKKGNVLAILNLDSVPADLIMAQSDLASAKQNLQELLDSSATLAEAQLAVIEARKNVEEAQNNFDALDYPHASDTLIKNQEAKIKEAEHNLVLLTRKYKEVQNHADGDPQKTTALLNMTNAQLALNELKATLNYYIAKPSEADYEEAKVELEIARANLEEARRKRDRVKGGADPLEIAAAEAKVAAAQAEVDAMSIIAPFDGDVIVVQSVASNPVSKGDAAVGLVNRSTMKIDTLIDETSISGVSVGDVAKITMDSLPGQTLNGVVSLIDPIGKTVSGLVKYTVTVSVETTDAPVLFGATATVVLITSEPHTMLAVPIGAIQSDATGEFVTRIKADGGSERIDIKSGDLSGNLVTITTEVDLKDGDKVSIGASTTTGSGSGGNNNQGGPGGGPFGIGG